MVAIVCAFLVSGWYLSARASFGTARSGTVVRHRSPGAHEQRLLISLAAATQLPDAAPCRPAAGAAPAQRARNGYETSGTWLSCWSRPSCPAAGHTHYEKPAKPLNLSVTTDRS